MRIPRGYEPAVGANWLNGHGFLGESRGRTDDDATKNVELVRVHTESHIRANVHPAEQPPMIVAIYWSVMFSIP